MAIACDLWQTFDFSTPADTAAWAAALAANDHCADANGFWVRVGTKCTTSASAEKELRGSITAGGSGGNDASGSSGLAILFDSNYAANEVKYEWNSGYLPATVSNGNMSLGFWLYIPSAALAQSHDLEPDLVKIENVIGARELYLKLDTDGGANAHLYLFNETDGETAGFIEISGNTWYWVTMLWTKGVGATNRLEVYDTGGTQVGSQLTRTSSNNGPTVVHFGSFVGEPWSSGSWTYWFDDLILDWTDATFPLGPGLPTTVAITGTATASITEADVVAGGKTIIATLTNDTYVVNTPTPPGIEAADCTVSGNNTASTSWAVSTPAASTGDLLIFCIAWDDSTATTDVTEPAGKNSETLTEVNATPVADTADVGGSGPSQRSKMWYCICTGTWTAGTIAFTPSASEQWSATVVRVPAGEFHGSTPIGASGTRASAAEADTAALSPAFTAGSTDGYGTLLWFAGVDTDPLSATPATGWTLLERQDIGAVAHGVCVRVASVTNSESIAGGDTWTIAGDTWTSIAVVVRAPTTNPFDTARQAYINGFDGSIAGGNAWDVEVKAKEVVTSVVRISSTEARLTLTAQAGYNIAEQETVTVTLPASALSGGLAVVATPTFTIDPAGGGGASVVPVFMHHYLHHIGR